MALQYSAKRNVTLCAGVSGSGKSTFTLRYLANSDLAIRFCFDPQGEFCERLRAPAAATGGELDLQLVRGWVFFDPDTLFPGRHEAAFAFFCDWAWTVSERIPGNKLLIVDEVWKYCSPQVIPAELATVVQTGRKHGLGLWVNTQQPQRTHGIILNEVSEAVCFRLQFDRSLDLVESWGFDGAEIAALPNLRFVARNLDSGGELRGEIAI